MSEARPGSDSVRETILRGVVSWSCAGLFMLYGFAKVTGSQFTVLDSRLATPLEDVSGFWLTWYFFGYSDLYKGFVALVEIVGGGLLVFRRTALAGALVLLPATVNIVLVNIAFGVDLGATVVAIVLAFGLLYLIGPHARQLLAVVFVDHGSTRTARLATVCGVVLVGVLTFSYTYWVANFNNRSPTEIDGTWEVVGEATEGISQVFFERNRAFWVAFMDEDGALRDHHFEIDGGRIRIWQEWLSKGDLVAEGESTGPEAIELRFANGARATLRRLSGPRS
ncbi:MAG: hypothetical protein F4060_07375 [Holophagales bacterium]|nr:hypothetical protein [Holophagales bacterium]MYG31904.1 hypothetical protein [Holophagales bacterium]MYI79746.1 hypothetical protein [Holophagales bacterium]